MNKIGGPNARRPEAKNQKRCTFCAWAAAIVLLFAGSASGQAQASLEAKNGPSLGTRLVASATAEPSTGVSANENLAVSTANPRAGTPKLLAAYDRLPLAFEANMGQTDARAQFLARGLGYTLLLSGPDAVLHLLQPTGPKDQVLRFHLVGARPAAARGEKKLESVTNYYLSNDPKKWERNVPNFAEVSYEDIYPGVEVRYYGHQGVLENDFVIAPEADPDQIRFSIEGADSVRLDGDGNLVITLEDAAGQDRGRHVVLNRPEIYQMVGGERRTVSGGFSLLTQAGNPNAISEIGFRLGNYEHTQPVVIDPTLTYSYNAPGGFSTLYGAMNVNIGPTLNVDASGEALLVGTTGLSNLQTTGNATQTSCASGTPQGNIICDAGSIYIAKFNSTGSALLFATYFGGSMDPQGFAGGENTALGTVDVNGNIYVAGQLTAVDLPLAPAGNPLLSTSSCVGSLVRGCLANYLAKFNSSGQLVYSTYLGQSDMTVYAVAADAAGDAYVGGAANTGYTDVPQINPLPLLCTSTCDDGFILGVKPDGTGYMYGTYVGGSYGQSRDGNTLSFAQVQALATYGVGGNFLAFGAWTGYLDMPLTTAQYAQAVQTSGGGYVALLDLGSIGAGQYIYATYLGQGGVTAVGLTAGTGSNYLDLYVGGANTTSGLPVTPGAFETLPANGFILPYTSSPPADAFVASFSVASPAVVTTNYISYLGGSTDEGTNIAAITGDANGNTWVAGTTTSTDFPLVNPLAAPCVPTSGNNSCEFPQCPPTLSYGSCQTGFISEVSPSGSLLFSTYFGGNTQDAISGLGLDPNGNVYVSGWTVSTNFPVTSGSLQPNCINPAFGTSSCVPTWFVTKLASQPTPAGPNVATFINGPNGSPLPLGGSISFPPTFAGFSESQVITLTNTSHSGTTPPLLVMNAMAGSTITTSSSFNSDFYAYPDEPGSGTGDVPCMPEYVPYAIQPGQSCDVTVTWSPSSNLQESSSVQIFDNAANGLIPLYFNLNGSAYNGSGATVTPNLLSFGSLILGQQTSGSVTVTSTGNQALYFSSPAFGLTGSPDFSISGTTCGTSLNAAFSAYYAPYNCTVSIAYTANGTPGVQESASLMVYDNSVFPGSPQTAVVTATTVLPEPQLVVSPTTVLSGISFPATAQGQPSETTSFQIQNLGTAPLAFMSSIFLSGGNSSDFHESDTCLPNNPLPVYASCTVNLYFQPMQPGGTVESSTLFILTNDPTNLALEINASGQSATPPGPPHVLPLLASVDNSVPPQQSTVSTGLPAISNGGQYIAFFAPVGYGSSSNDNLPNPPAANSGADGLYLRNTCAGPNAPAGCTQSTEFVAYSTSGAACYFQQYGSPGAVYAPAISSDGRFVAFADANCSASGGNGLPTSYIFLRDTQLQTTTQITDQGDTPLSGGFTMSANAQFFGFESNTEAVGRSAGDTSTQVYLNDTGFSYGGSVGTPATILVSQDNNGSEDGSYNNDFVSLSTPAVSPDGRFVAFSSPWNDLSGGGNVSSGSGQVYLRDTCVGAPQGQTCTPKTILISSPDNAGTFGSGGNSGEPANLSGISTIGIAVSAGGRYVAFVSSASNLPRPMNASGYSQMYLRDTCQSYGQQVCGSGDANPGTTTLLSAPAAGSTPGSASAPQISSDGRIITFLSDGQLTANAPVNALYAYDTCLSNGQSVGSACNPGLLGVISATLSNGGQPVSAMASSAALDGSGQFVAYAGPSSEVWLNGTGIVATAGPLPTVYIDAPTSGATVSGIVTVSGWAVDNASTVGTAISSVQVQVDGNMVGTATYGLSRPDVCAAYPGRRGCPNVGYAYSLNTSGLSAGTHTITVTAADSDTTPDVGAATVTVTVQATPPTVWIDSPTANASVSGIIPVTGWALDNAATVGTTISSVQVQVDGTVVGSATYGSSRPDVCAVYTGRPGCPNVGYSYSLNTSSLSPGSHTITVTATDSDVSPDSGSASVTVNVQATPPTVWIDSPAANANVSGVIQVVGWAIDNAATVGTAISSVQVKVDGTVVGTATYGSSRPDVCMAYSGRPGCPNVGYSYSLNTSSLSPGAHTITVTATDSDASPDSGSMSVNVSVQATPPTVWIDSPTPNASVSGSIPVVGWAIDNAATVGTAISSVQVLVDGTSVGFATYGSSRPDVCAVYPGRPSCPNVGFSYSLDTSSWSPGTHTITVIATDSDATPDSGSASVSVTK